MSNDSPVLLDRFLNDAIEVDVDAFLTVRSDDRWHHGAYRASRRAFRRLGLFAAAVQACRKNCGMKFAARPWPWPKALNVVGLMNVQFAIQNGDVYVLEVNPRASRTVPFVSRQPTPLAKIAARCMAGATLDSQGVKGEVIPPYYSVKGRVFPFIKFPGVDTILGPEMKSTGEVMGVGATFAEAFVKSQLAASVKLPTSGNVFISVKLGPCRSRRRGTNPVAAWFRIVRHQRELGAIAEAGIPVTLVNKVNEGRPNIVDLIKNGQIRW